MVSGGDPVTDLRFWHQVIEDARRTVLCPPGLADQVREAIARQGMAGGYDVREQPGLEGQILMVDHNAIAAYERAALQAMRRLPIEGGNQ